MSLTTYEYTEAIRTKLTQPLTAYTEYELNFDVSKEFRKSSTGFDNFIKFQAYLGYTDSLSSGEGFIPNEFNGIFLQNTEFSTSTDSWDHINIIFMTGAVAGQAYLTIGALGCVDQNNVVTHPVELMYPANNFYSNSYYYIDNISLVNRNKPCFFNQCLTQYTENETILSPFSHPETRQSSDWIRNTNTISTNASLVEHAANYIELKPGFWSQNGSRFRGYIQACSVAPNYVGRQVNPEVKGIVENSRLDIFPNPTNDFITIQSENIEIHNIMIVSFDGKVVYNQSVNTKTEQLDLSNYASGIYLLNIQTQDGEMHTRKLIKK